MYISSLILDCNQQIAKLRKELQAFKAQLRDAGEGSREFLQLQAEEAKRRIQFHAGVRSQVARSLRQAEAARALELSTIVNRQA